MNKFLIASMAAATAAIPSLHAQTLSWPVGYRTEPLSQGHNLIGLTLQFPTLVSGRNLDSFYDSGTDTTELNKAGAFASLVSGNTYILEVTSGTHAGVVQEFTSFDSNNIYLPGDIPLTREDTFQIRKAPTLEELFGTTTSPMTKSIAPTNADKVWIPTGGGTYAKYYLHTTSQWRDVATNTAAPNTPLIYLDGILIERLGATTNSTQILGELKKGNTLLPIEQGINLVNTYSPVGVTLQNFGLEDDLAPAVASAIADILWKPTAPSVYAKYFQSTISLTWKDAATNANVTSAVDLPSCVLVERRSATPGVFDSVEAPSDQDHRFSPVLPAAISKSGSTFQADFTVQKGKTYQAQTSTDRVTWTDLGSAVTASSTTLSVTDTSATETAKLYRLSSGPIRQGFDQNKLVRHDDGGSVNPSLGFSLNFFGSTYSQVWVNNNGNLTFGSSFSTYQPGTLRESGQKIIAPFWADVDTLPYDGGEVFYGTGTIGGRNAFATQWRDVGYFNSKVDMLASFQVVIIDRGDISSGDFDLEFNYHTMPWEEGDATTTVDDGFSTGSSNPPRVGVASGLTSFFELANSGVAGSFTDCVPRTTTLNSSGLIYQSKGSAIPGRLVFQSRSGVINEAILVNAGTDFTAPSSSATLTGTATYGGAGSLSYLWTQEGSGPTATITSPTALSTGITLPGAGTYTFRLTATTGTSPAFSASDTIVVTR